MWQLDMKVPSDNGPAPIMSTLYAFCTAHNQTEALCPAAACLGCHQRRPWVRLKAFEKEALTKAVRVRRQISVWVCTTDTWSSVPPHQHACHMHTGWELCLCPSPGTRHVQHRDKRVKGWSQDGKAKKPSLHCCPNCFPWLTCAPLPSDSIFLASCGRDSTCDSRWYLLPCESLSACSHTCFDLFCLDLQYHSWTDKCKVTHWQRFLKITELFTYLNTNRTCSLAFTTCDYNWFKSNLPFEFKTETETTATTYPATMVVSPRTDQASFLAEERRSVGALSAAFPSHLSSRYLFPHLIPGANRWSVCNSSRKCLYTHKNIRHQRRGYFCIPLK